MTDDETPEWDCPCEHPPGWHFTGGEALAILAFVLFMILIVKLS